MDLRLGRLSWRFLLASVLLHAVAGAATAVFGSSAGWVLAPMFAGLAALGFSAPTAEWNARRPGPEEVRSLTQSVP